MRYLSWFVKLALVILLSGFALKNAQMVTLRYYFDYQWEAPLVLLLLVFLIIGVAMGLLASLGTVFRQRREITQLKRAAQRFEKTQTVQPLVPADAIPHD